MGEPDLLHEFAGFGGDGAFPVGIVRDASGAICGSTRGGGSEGSGTFFEIDPAGGYSVPSFCEFCGEPNGDQPVGAPVVMPDGSGIGTSTARISATSIG